MTYIHHECQTNATRETNIGPKRIDNSVIVKTERHCVDLSSTDVQYVGDNKNIEMGLYISSSGRYTLHIKYVEEELFDEKIMSFCVKNEHGVEYAYLDHLYIPKSAEGIGLGKLCLSVFYAIMKRQKIDGFCMKFGGGSKSLSFLRNLDFPTGYTDTIRNRGHQSNSVVMGDYQSLGNRCDQWDLRPIHIDNFPDSFVRIE